MTILKILTLSLAISSLIGILLKSASAVEPYVDPVVALRKDLLGPEKYDPLTAPQKELPTIHMKMLIQHVYKLEESTGTLIINGWLSSIWHDDRLKWDWKNYNNVSLLRLPHHMIWVPDFTLFNNAEAMKMDHFGETRAIVTSIGFVYWLVPLTLRATCPISLQKYPFDEHDCILSLGPWSYTTIEMFMAIQQIDEAHENEVLARFSYENPEWELIRNQPEIRNKTYECCPDLLYQTYEVGIRLRRRAPFYKYVVVVPSAAATLMTLSVFWLPPDHESKFTIGGIAAITQMMLLAFLGWKIPPGGSTVPSIVIFCGNGLVMSVLAMVISVIVIRLIHSAETSRVPEPIVTLFRGPFGKLFCLHPPEDSSVWSTLRSLVRAKAEERGEAQLIDGAQLEVESLEIKDASTKATSVEEWHLLAKTVDRLSFIVYCIVLIGILASLFP